LGIKKPPEWADARILGTKGPHSALLYHKITCLFNPPEHALELVHPAPVLLRLQAVQFSQPGLALGLGIGKDGPPLARVSLLPPTHGIVHLSDPDRPHALLDVYSGGPPTLHRISLRRWKRKNGVTDLTVSDQPFGVFGGVAAGRASEVEIDGRTWDAGLSDHEVPMQARPAGVIH